MPHEPAARLGRRAILLFVDGVGYGTADPGVNPLARLPLPALERLAGGRLADDGSGPPPRLHPLDARLGVSGLPQSGTGQTALLTGVNAARLLGHHRGPYPGVELHPLLAGESLFARLKAAGEPVAFANAFPERFMERVERGQARLGAFSRAALLAGVPLRGEADLAAGRAISGFIDNAFWPAAGTDSPGPVSALEAGRRLARLALDHRLTVFEHWATDLAGHHPERWSPEAILARLDAFVDGLAGAWPQDDLLVIASDHGNLEDGTSGRHTLNPALCIWRGPAPARPLASLTDVAPAILDALGLGGGPEREAM